MANHDRIGGKPNPRSGKKTDDEIAYIQAHVNEINSMAKLGKREPKPLFANGETLMDLRRATDAIMADPAKLAEAHKNLAANEAFLDKVVGPQIAQ